MCQESISFAAKARLKNTNQRTRIPTWPERKQPREYLAHHGRFVACDFLLQLGQLLYSGTLRHISGLVSVLAGKEQVEEGYGPRRWDAMHVGVRMGVAFRLWETDQNASVRKRVRNFDGRARGHAS